MSLMASSTCKGNAWQYCNYGYDTNKYSSVEECHRLEPIARNCAVKDGENGGLRLPTQTGLKVIDETVAKIVAWEQSKLSNPIVQVTLLGLAGFGIYALFFSKQ